MHELLSHEQLLLDQAEAKKTDLTRPLLASEAKDMETLEVDSSIHEDGALLQQNDLHHSDNMIKTGGINSLNMVTTNGNVNQ